MVPLRVLIADENEEFRSTLAKDLSEQYGVVVIGEADNGFKAVVMTRDLHPDLLLMNVSMRGMSGLEATRKIKKQLPNVRIVLVTNHEEQAIGALASSVDAENCIFKGSLRKYLSE